MSSSKDGADSPLQNPKMCEELNRLVTFRDWNPEIYGPEQSRLAAAGFLHTGRDGVVECFSCGMTFCCVNGKVDPVSEHAAQSPNCLSQQQNKPWCIPASSLPDRERHLQPTGQSPIQDTSFETSQGKDMLRRRLGFLQKRIGKLRRRLQRLNNQRHESVTKFRGKQVLILENYYSRLDDIMDSMREMSSGVTEECLQMEEEDKMFVQLISLQRRHNQHLKKMTSQRKQRKMKLKKLETAKKILQKLYSLGMVGVDKHDGTASPKLKPKFREFRSKRARQRSYQAEKGWPEQVPHTIEQLAECGFFSLEIDDRVKCFSCGVTLRNLKMIDDLWDAHEKKSRGCVYLAKQKGSDIVSVATEECPSTELTSTVLDDGESTKPPNLDCLPIPEARSRNSSSSSSSSSSNGTADSTEGKPIDEEDVKMKWAEYENAKEERLCKVCFQKTISMALLDCGHTACESCARRLEKCHICRDEIKGRQEILFDGFRHDHSKAEP